MQCVVCSVQCAVCNVQCVSDEMQCARLCVCVCVRVCVFPPNDVRDILITRVRLLHSSLINHFKLQCMTCDL